jgi:hypothetical protein
MKQTEELLTRTLIGPADPAPAAVPPARANGAELIARAESAGAARTWPRRRLVLTAAAAVAAVGSGYTLWEVQSRRQPERGEVLTPIAYQFRSDPPPAGPYLRALAARIVDAPYDRQLGRYAHHRIRMWGVAADVGTPGRAVDFPLERESWVAEDGSGVAREHYLPPEFPDEESRRHWQDGTVQTAPPPGTVVLPPNSTVERLPSDRRQLAGRMQIGHGIGVVVKYTGLLFQDYVVPRGTRAAILSILAQQPGLVWRGEVTDRAGRAGVAVSGDHANEQAVLVFDPRTGVLLAQEYIEQASRPRGYTLVLETDRTERPG